MAKIPGWNETMERYADEIIELAVKRWVREKTDGKKRVVLGEVEGYRIVAIQIKRGKNSAVRR